jgi:drug/metabolite transporter (DMT)-like permease
VIAILGGLGAAVGFCATTLSYARLARMLPPYVVVSWVMLVGLLITVPLVALSGIPDDLDASSAGWLAIGGFGNVGGLLVTYRALRTGKVSVIAPIVSTEGAIAAVLAVATGEKLAAASAVTLALIVAGILLASLERTGQPAETRQDTTGAARLAFLAAVAFGASLYAVGRVGRELPVAWALLPARAVGVGVVAVPLAFTSGLRLTRPALPYVLAGGIFEVIGISSYTLGARHGLAVSAVLASQFGALAAVAGFFFFRERLSRVQVLGVVAIAVGVAVLSGLQA